MNFISCYLLSPCLR